MNSIQETERFRMELLRKMPFYGDIIMRIPFEENRSIRTARTNGRRIEYNPDFLDTLTPGQQHYVLMHEMFHILLLHCRRSTDKNPKIWNTAADLIVNSMLDRLRVDLIGRNISFERPPEGIFGLTDDLETVENLYEKLLEINRQKDLKYGTVHYKAFNRRWIVEIVEGRAPDDLADPPEDSLPPEARTGKDGLRPGSGAPEGFFPTEILVAELIREAAEKNRGEIGSFYLPRQILKPVESRRIDWKSLLRDFLSEEQSDETSYTTPERKYIHMDLILPGHSLDAAHVEEIWAFVDSSGSISQNELQEFLTQLARIAGEFECVFHICYWDTEVTDVYHKVTQEKKIWECCPHHSGGTDINCVYRWLQKEHVRPPVMLILTDGYFGPLDNNTFIPSLKRNTILVLSGNIAENETMRRIGRITRL